MKLTRVCLMASLLVVPVMLLTGCKNEAKERSSAEGNMKSAKVFIASLKSTFEAGDLVQKPDPDARGSMPDMRMATLTVLVRDKVPYTITKKVTDDAIRTKAMEKMTEVQAFMEKSLLTKYDEASRSRKPEDIKALAPLLDQLDKQLDEVIKIIE